jgi:predicted nucleic acid-binding protein
LIESPENEIYTSIISISELMSISKRDREDAEKVYRNITGISKISFLSLEIAKEAGILHSEIRKKIKDFGMADSIILVTARKLNAKVTTCDNHFKGFKEAILL